MPLSLEFRVTNYQKVVRVLAMLTNQETYRGFLRDTITEALKDLRDYAAEITHKETGTLAKGQSWEYNSHTMKGRLFIAPWAVKADGNRLQWAATYGIYEHNRGGDHAFYERTMRERAPYTAVRELRANVTAFIP